MLTRSHEHPGAGDRLRGYRRALRAVARRLGRLLRPLDAPDLRAMGALQGDGQPHPWTAEAEAIWTRARGGHRRAHHLAVLLHARAYDLEAEGRPEASRYWREALTWWAQVHRDDAFWQRLQDGLARRMGVEIDPGLVPAVRRRLPTHLLQVHADLVRTYQDRAPTQARTHLRLLRSARFDPDHTEGDPTEEHCAALLRPTIDSAWEHLEADQWQEAVDSLRAWVDHDDPQLIRWQLHAYRRWNEGLRHDDPQDRRQLLANLEESQRVAERLDERTVDQAQRELREELARYHYWKGTTAADDTRERLRRLDDSPLGADEIRELRAAACRSSALALTHFDQARRLDPGLTTEAGYGGIDREQPVMRIYQASCRIEAIDKRMSRREKQRELLAAIELLTEAGRADCGLLRDAHRLISRAGLLADQHGVKVDKELRALRQLLQDCRQSAARP